MRRWFIIGSFILGCGIRASADSVQPIVPTSQVTYGSNQRLITSNSDVKIDTTTHILSANQGINTIAVHWSDGSTSTSAVTGSGSLAVKLGGNTVASPTTTLNLDTNTFTASQSPTGTANVTAKVDTTTANINYAYLFNGTKAVWAAQGTNFSFGITSFADGQAGTIEEGVGVWKSTGNISFTAIYSNGPPTASTVTFSGWSALPMTGSFLGPTATVANTNYPSVAGTNVFTLNATNGVGSPTSAITHTFNNDRYWGTTSVSGGYVSSDIIGLGNNDLVNSIPTTFTVNAGGGQYIVFAYPSRLGTASFAVGGFSGGFNTPSTVSVTNGSAFTENFSVYRSIQSGLGSTTVTVTTP